MFGSYVLQHYFCTRFREGKVTRTVRHGDGPGRKKEKNFRKSLAVQKNSLPLRSRSESKVVQVSRPDGCPDRMSRQLKTGTKRQ